jgi:tRNA(adenine34) deaminase
VAEHGEARLERPVEGAPEQLAEADPASPYTPFHALLAFGLVKRLSSQPSGDLRSLDMELMSEDDKFMRRAIELALLAEREGNLPVGAVITLRGQTVAEGRSAIWVPKFDATRHAEMEALRAVSPDLWISSAEMTIYTTLEPCLMCFGSILLHRVGRVVFGSSDYYGGASSTLTHLPPFFRERIEATQWLGPIMPVECDPLRERLLELEGSSKRADLR